MFDTRLIKRKSKKRIKQHFMLFAIFLVFFSGMLPSFASMSTHAEGINFEEPDVSIDVDGESKKELIKGENLNYNVKVILPDDPSGYESMKISDDLDERLAIQDTSVLINGEENNALEETVNEQEVSLTLTEEQLETFAGKEIKLQITTQIKEESEITEEIENVAEVVINDDIVVKTDPVIVTLVEASDSEEKDEDESEEGVDSEQPEEVLVEETVGAGTQEQNEESEEIQPFNAEEFEVNHIDSYGNSWETPSIIYQFDGNNPSATPKSSITVRGVAANKLLNGLALSKHNNHFYIASGTELFRIDPSGASLKVTDLLGPTGNGAMSVDGTEYYYSYGQDGKVFFASFDLVSRAHNSIEVSGLDSNVNSLGGDLLVDADGLIWFTQGDRLIQFDPTDGDVMLNTELPSDDPNASGRGLSFLPDGKMLLAGGAGNDSNPMLYIYDPKLHEISFLGNMPGAVIVDLASAITPSFNPPVPGELKIIKEDEEDGTRLARATFELRNADDNKVGELVTDENGEAVLQGLEKGSYTLIETIAPEGYKLKDEALEVLIESDKPTVITIKNSKLSEPIDPPDVCAAPVALINGSFEEPINTAYWWQGHPQENVPGWSTTDSTGRIEIWNTNNNNKVIPAKGNQFAELNAYESGMLYQDVITTPGQTLYWRLAHRGRAGEDTMQLRIGAVTNNPYDAPVVEQMTDGNAEWGEYSGTYTVPAGQTVTRFGFEAVSAAGGNKAVGNFLDDIFLGTEPCVTVEKSVDPEGEVLAGDELTYEIVVKNTGGDIAANTIFEDNIPEGTEFIPGSIKVDGESIDDTHYDSVGNNIVIELGDLPNTNDLPKGITVEFKVKTLSSHIGETVLNKAQIKYENLLVGQNEEVETNEVETPIISKDPELESTKSSTLETKADGNTDADNPEVGDTIRYTITTQNTIEDSLVENLVITDMIPEGLTYVIGSLEVDGEAVTDTEDDDAGHVVDGQVTGNFGDITDTNDHTVTFLVTIDEGQAGKDINNIAVVEGDNADPDEPEEEVKIYPREPNLESEKSAVNLEEGKETFEVGDTIVYTIQSRNTVSDSLASNFTIIDELPEGLEFVEGSLEVSHEGTGEFEAGTIIATFGDVEDSEWRTVTFEAIVLPGQSEGEIENTAQVTIDENEDPDEPTTVVTIDPKDPDIDSEKSSEILEKLDGNTDLENPEVGDTLLYTIQTRNTVEDSLLMNLVIFDELPDGLEYIAGSLEVDGVSVTDAEDDDAGRFVNGQAIGHFGDIRDTDWHTLTLQVIVGEGQAGENINNIATVDGDNLDEPDEPEEEVLIYPRKPDLESEKIAVNLAEGKEVFEVGDTVVYTIQTRNTVSDSLAQNLVITDELPEGLEFVEGSLSVSHDGEATFADGVVTARFGDVSDTEWRTVTFEAIIESGQSGETIENVATVEGDDVPPTNPGTEIIVDPKDPELDSTKSSTLETKADGNTDADNPEVGDTIRYTIQTKNTIEDSLIENLVITDNIPEGLTYVAGSLEIDGESVTDASDDDAGHVVDGEVTGNFGDITDTDQHTVTFLVTVNEGQAGKDINNIAEVKGDNTDTDEPEEDVKVYPRKPILESEKTASHLEKGKETYEVGDIIVYTIKARNTVTDSLVENLVITDELPEGLTFVEGSLDISHDGEGKVSDGVITAHFGDVGNTEWRQITFQVEIEADQHGKVIENIAEVNGENVKEPHTPIAKVDVEPNDSTPIPEDQRSGPTEEKGQELPRTASNNFNLMFIGLVALVVGILMISMRRKRSN